MNQDATARLQHAIGIKTVEGVLIRPPAGGPDWRAAQRAIQDGADLDAPLCRAPSWTLLTNACRWNIPATVLWLLDQGADPNAAGQGGYLPLSDAEASAKSAQTWPRRPQKHTH